jgi:hypothetical protein
MAGHTNERLHAVLAELFANREPGDVLRTAGLSANVDLSGPKGDVWGRIVNALKNTRTLPSLILYARDEAPAAASRLSAAFNREYDPQVAYEEWERWLARDEQRKATENAFEWENRSPVVALIIVGGTRQGQAYFAEWARLLRNDRVPTVRVPWPPQSTTPEVVAKTAAKQLHRVCKLADEGCPEPPDDVPAPDPARWSRWGQQLAESLLRVWTLDARGGADPRTLVFVRHQFSRATPDAASAVRRYLELVWSPIARHTAQSKLAGVRLVPAFEVACDDESTLAAFTNIATHPIADVQVPPLARLDAVTAQEVHRWLGQHEQPRLNRLAEQDERDVAVLAREAVVNEFGVYEGIVEFFKRGVR